LLSQQLFCEWQQPPPLCSNFCVWLFVWLCVLFEVAGALAVELSWLPWFTSEDPPPRLGEALVLAVTGVDVAVGTCVTVTVWGALVAVCVPDWPLPSPSEAQAVPVPIAPASARLASNAIKQRRIRFLLSSLQLPGLLAPAEPEADAWKRR
jgi:hypothetical protein